MCKPTHTLECPLAIMPTGLPLHARAHKKSTTNAAKVHDRRLNGWYCRIYV